MSVCLKKACTIVCLETPFSKNSYHMGTNKLIDLQINWSISIWYDFLLRCFQTLIAANVIVIICRIILVLYDLNSTNQVY